MLSFGWVVLFCALASILAIRFKIPHVPALLIIGVIIGPNLLGLVDSGVLDLFSEIGAVLLLFGIGVQFSITKLFAKGVRALVASLLLMLLTFIFMHEVAILLGFNGFGALFAAAIFSMSSTAIMIKILEYEGFIGRKDVELLVAMLIVEDIVAVFLLAFFSNPSLSMHSDNEILLSLTVAFAVLAFSYLILGKIMNWITTVLTRERNNDIIMFISFSLGIGMSIIASVIGLTPAIGAFLAGSITASLPNGRTFERTMKPFTILFSALFFLSIGMLVDPYELYSSVPQTLSMVLLFSIAIFVFAMTVSYLLSTSLKSAVFAGAALLPLGEFSLLIARAGSNLVAFNAINLAATGVVVSTFLCTIALRYNQPIYSTTRKIIPENLLKSMAAVSLYFREILNTFEFNGRLNMLLKRELTKLTEDVARMLLAAILFFLARQYAHFLIELPWFSVWTDSLALGFIITASLSPVFRIAKFMKRLLDVLSEEFSRTTTGSDGTLVVRNMAVAGLLFGFYASIPHVVDILMLPKTFALLSIGFALLSLLFLWSTIRMFSTMFFAHSREKKKHSK